MSKVLKETAKISYTNKWNSQPQIIKNTKIQKWLYDNDGASVR